MKLTIIGAGNMGRAIALGLSSAKGLPCYARNDEPIDIYCADRSASALDKLRAANPSMNVTTDNIAAVKNAEVVILAVKPWLIETVIREIKPALDYKKQMMVSIAAGVTFTALCAYLEKEKEGLPPVFRVMPNTAIEVKESVNLVAAHNATEAQINLIKSLFDELGRAIVIEEHLMAAGTALASCGLAFAFRYIRAAVEGAVELGLSAERAKEIELNTLKGAVALLEAKKQHPEAEIDKITTPGGITIKGLNAMEEAGFTNAVIKGLKASCR